MSHQVPNKQPQMDFPAKDIPATPIFTTAPPRPPFDDTFSILCRAFVRAKHQPQPNYPYPSRYPLGWRY